MKEHRFLDVQANRVLGRAVARAAVRERDEDLVGW
jgi:hypothetical protein